MRVMTFNLRFENDLDGDNSWQNRRDMVVEIINRYAPDILGTQEGKWPQLMYLCEGLPGYRAHLPGRSADKVTQCPTLFIREETLKIRGGSDFWLSRTPDVFLSKDWDSAFPRMISCSEVRDEHTGQKFFAAVTHLDHIGTEARYNQARIIADWANGADAPVVLMGDFNDTPGSRVHRALTTETALRDTWKLLEKSDGAESYTHHGFMGTPQLARMDWILVSPGFRVVHAEILHDQVNGCYPSDHFPYVADIDWG